MSEIEKEKFLISQDNATGISVHEAVERRIYILRGKKVMLDHDLAKLYGVSTKILNQAVRRNIERFPPDFMYLLTNKEVAILRSQIVTSRLQVVEFKSDTEIGRSGEWGGVRWGIYAFTEQGIAMLSSVLRNPRAVQVNIQIMRTFTKLREMLASNDKLREKIEEMEKKYDQQFQVVFEAIKKLLEPIVPEKPKRSIGFHAKSDGSKIHSGGISR